MNALSARFALVALAVLLVLPTQLFPQISSATLIGTVTDSTGAAVAGATVEAKNRGTLAARTATTDSNGDYVIPNLVAAHYSVTITTAGFKTYSVPDIELQVAQRAQVDARLELGTVQQELVVNSVSPILETSNSAIGQVVSTTIVENMPLNGRSFWQLTALTPGALYTPGGQGTRTGGSSIRSSAVNVTINGGAPNQTGWFLDGAFITEMQTGGTLIQPNVDALQEFKVEGASMMAEYGRTPNVVNATMRSGSNQWHGSAYDFLRNSFFDARNFFFIPPAGSTETKDALRRNQYGFTVGGPIRRDKTFFFADYEKTGLLQAVDFNNVVPSDSMRTGNFSELLKGSKPVTLLNPLTRQPFPGNIIPTSMLAPQGQYFLKYLPTANSIQGSTNYAALTNNLLQHQNRADIRVDQLISGKTQLFGRYSINDNNENDPNPFPALGSFPLQSRSQNATITLTHLFSSKWVNDTRVSYYRSIFLFGGTLEGTNFNKEAGVQGFDDTTSVFSFPQITLTNYATFTGSPSDQRPKSNRIRNWQYADNLSYSSGRHNVKIGGDLLHQTAGFFNGSRSVGIFNFAGTYSNNSFADFLLGYPDSVTRDYFKQLNGDWANFGSIYAQDSFRITPNLTLNFGARLEFNSFYNGIRGQKSAFDLTNGKLIIPSSIDSAVQPLTPTLLSLFSDRLGYTRDRGLPDSIQPMPINIAPRFGFAWRPPDTKNLVIRSSYGIFYTYPDSNTIDNTVATVPFIATQTVFNDRVPAVPSRTWANFFLSQPAVGPNPNPGQPCSFGFAALSCATPDVDSGAINFKSTSVQEWTFAVQRQFGSATSLR
jgi:Carboxypeptidase regulatory-like domain